MSTPPLSEKDRVFLNRWPFLGEAKLQLNHGKTSNKIYTVKAQSGEFILKIYRDSVTTEQIHYEHSLLAHLQSCKLSFTVPTPVPASSGETLVTINQDDTQLRAALLPLLPGQAGDRQNVHHARAAGRALAELHGALAPFDAIQSAQLPSWGDLEHIHPMVGNPFEVTETVAPQTRSRLFKLITEVLEAKPRLYRSLPIQTIHADYFPPNILFESNQVVGVLDFEFATNDLRLIDYICGLDNFALFPRTEAPRWEFIQAFGAGYHEYASLTPQEIAALVLVWRLQLASNIIYWTGWLREGKVSKQTVIDAVSETLMLEDWFEDNQTKLLNECSLK